MFAYCVLLRIVRAYTHQIIVIASEIECPDGLHMRFIGMRILRPLVDLIYECQHDRESVLKLMKACKEQVSQMPQCHV